MTISAARRPSPAVNLGFAVAAGLMLGALAWLVMLVPAEDGIREADVVLLLVDHDAFASLGATTEGKKVIDTRGQWR